jgi:hypothetical protein
MAAAFGFMLATGPAWSVVVCQKGKSIKLRDTCKPKEITLFELNPEGVQGPPGPAGPPGPFPSQLGSGETLRGHYYVAGAVAEGAPGALAYTALSYIFQLPTVPTKHVVFVGEVAPAECTGTDENPEAAPGHLCVYETADSNIDLLEVTDVTTNGATIFIHAVEAGSYFSSGSWAVTAP